VLSKQKGNWQVNAAIGAVSPGYEINDLGYLPVTNDINMHIGSMYHGQRRLIFHNAQLGQQFFELMIMKAKLHGRILSLRLFTIP